MKLGCIKCGKAADQASIRVDLDNADIHCSDCDETFTIEEVEEFVTGWVAVLPWLKQHPARRQPACVNTTRHDRDQP